MSPAPLPKRKSPFDEFDDFYKILCSEIPDPDELIDGLIYERSSHWLSGHPKSGKTILAMWVAYEMLCAGRHVIWLDYENGVLRLARRFQEMGVDEGVFQELFHYKWAAPIKPSDPELRDDLTALIEQFPGAVVIFDSQAKALAMAGLSEDKADDVTIWTTTVVLDLCNRLAATVVVIDHMAKDAGKKSGYSRGSGAKAADADVSLYCEVISDTAGRKKPRLDRNSIATVEVTLWHDRDGLANDAYFLIGDKDGGLPIERIKRHEVERPATATDDLIARVIEYLNPIPEWTTKADIARALEIGIKSGTLTRALDQAADKGLIDREPKQYGPRYRGLQN